MGDTKIHPTAVVHQNAALSPGCEIGPGAVIDADVVLGPNCLVGPNVYITGLTTAGPGSRFHAGCVIGDAPQDLKYRGEPTRLHIGADNVFREHATVHRSATVGEPTIIGDGNLIMAGAHVGHNCRVGSHTVIANGAQLAGHAEVGDRAFISGNCLIHQYCRVGRLAMMQGGARIGLDLPPYCVAWGVNRLCGLNTIGLRRAGVSASDRLILRRAYQTLFRFNGRRQAAVEEARIAFAGSPLVHEWMDFLTSSRRGVCVDVGRRGAPGDESGAES